MVLIGDVDVMPGPHVVADLDAQMPDDPEPLPNRQRSPMVITGSDTMLCPGTMPADSVICGPNIVPAPMWM